MPKIVFDCSRATNHSTAGNANTGVISHFRYIYQRRAGQSRPQHNHTVGLWSILASMVNQSSSPTALEHDADRRSPHSRRSYSCRTLLLSLWQPRRSTSRRRRDRQFPITDVLDSSAVFLALLLVLFSCTDAAFTLTLISKGGSELNPIMNYFLQQGIGPFLTVKLLLTTIPAIILTASSNVIIMGRFRARTALAALVGVYAGVIVYELGLLSLT